MSKIRQDSDGELLPKGTLVFRIGKGCVLSPAAIEKGTAVPEMFVLSTKDKESPGKRLSIWVEELTVADQAWGIMGSHPDNNVVACLKVDRLHAIPAPDGFVPLRAEWEQATTDDDNGNSVPNTYPGAEGHAGIANLGQGGEGKDHKRKRHLLRSKLADIADLSPVPVPHNFPDDHLRVAAYYISQGSKSCAQNAESRWVSAIRQLRRARGNHDRGGKNELGQHG